MQFLVPCDNLVVSGGLLRFDRLGQQLSNLGHELTFLILSETAKPQRETDRPTLNLVEAKSKNWDATMVPGAGFPDETIEKFALLRESQFGIRVQHVLNDQTRYDRFLKVNRVFSPNIVVFNNLAWPLGSYDDFSANHFQTLLGGVDYDRLGGYQRKTNSLKTPWVIGGLANKNPLPLLESIHLLPVNIVVRLYGSDIYQIKEKYATLVESGRIKLCGRLTEEQLGTYYANVDCVVMTEQFAGWSNLVAESMAAGVPVICTRHGTQAIAFDNDTALIVDNPNSRTLATAILRLFENDALCESLSVRARDIVKNYSWSEYAQGFLKILNEY